MNQKGSVDSSIPTLLSLPAEVLTHICAYLVPSNATFLLNSRVPGTHASSLHSAKQIFPRVRGTPLVPEDEVAPEHPSAVFGNFGVNIFTLLLLHSRIHSHVVTNLYSNNVFYPPDMTTLLYLRKTLSSRAVSCVRTIRVDACGPVARFTRGYNHFYGWSQLSETSVIDIPKLFPGVRELRLGGIGPGVVHRRIFTYRGSRCVRDTEISDVWTSDNITLIGKIIGVCVAGGPEAVESDTGATGTDHTLSGGRVFCMRHDGSASLPRGSCRLHGTRILRRGEPMITGSMEQEIIDIPAALTKAVEARNEFKALGFDEVSVRDFVPDGFS